MGGTGAHCCRRRVLRAHRGALGTLYGRRGERDGGGGGQSLRHRASLAGPVVACGGCVAAAGHRVGRKTTQLGGVASYVGSIAYPYGWSLCRGDRGGDLPQAGSARRRDFVFAVGHSGYVQSRRARRYRSGGGRVWPAGRRLRRHRGRAAATRRHMECGSGHRVRCVRCHRGSHRLARGVAGSRAVKRPRGDGARRGDVLLAGSRRAGVVHRSRTGGGAAAR